MFDVFKVSYKKAYHTYFYMVSLLLVSLFHTVRPVYEKHFSIFIMKHETTKSNEIGAYTFLRSI